MHITTYAALWFLPFVLPICVWIAWSDLRIMKIPNLAVMALVAVFLVVGLVALPLADYPWRLLHLAIVLVIGIVMNAAGMIGAGDAKFTAAAAPFVAIGDLQLLLVILAADGLSVSTENASDSDHAFAGFALSHAALSGHLAGLGLGAAE